MLWLCIATEDPMLVFQFTQSNFSLQGDVITHFGLKLFVICSEMISGAITAICGESRNHFATIWISVYTDRYFSLQGLESGNVWLLMLVIAYSCLPIDFDSVTRSQHPINAFFSFVLRFELQFTKRMISQKYDDRSKIPTTNFFIYTSTR